jgi:hypothetical protein
MPRPHLSDPLPRTVNRRRGAVAEHEVPLFLRHRWPPSERLTVSVLVQNTYDLTLEIMLRDRPPA